ncbi:hypothetical protein FGADI_11510 [Fusarium gaditjirri]|uniref:Uncharacterized protein n=1 Tax=Fusarium gaditjirri TaxID=282569 RepID=A0A8H4WQ58_9HYPO|nr:hypothetical protein FGADI_11510 [Fusarium gaditjirri]
MKFTSILLQAIIYSPILAAPMPKGPAELVQPGQIHGTIEPVEPDLPDLERRKVPAKSHTTALNHRIKPDPPSLERRKVPAKSHTTALNHRIKPDPPSLERRKVPAKSHTTALNHRIKPDPPSARGLESST